MESLAIITGADIRTFGGGERYALELTKRLKNNFTISYFSRREKVHRINDAQLGNMLSGKLHYFNAIRIPISGDWAPLTSSGIKMILNLRKFDTVYIMDHSLPTIALITFLLRMGRAKTRIILGIHSPLHLLLQEKNIVKKLLFPIYKRIYKFVIFSVPNIHVINSESYQLLKFEGYKKNLFFIPNFIYIKRSHKIKKNKNKFVVLFVGRLQEYEKGIDLLLRIIEKIINKNKEIIFDIVGSGEAKDRILRLSKRYRKNVMASL